jgi:hypothetical protein
LNQRIRGVAAAAVLIFITASCASKPKPTPAPAPAGPSPSQIRSSPTTQPILYHRTGGIAGTDDRVVIWPDGVVEVDGKLMTDAKARVTPQRMEHLAHMFDGWGRLDDSYVRNNVEDAYLIRIYYGGKAVEATDINPQLPQQFRDVFAEIEAIAAQAANAEPKPAAP